MHMCHAAINARHQAEKRRLQAAMAPPANKDSVPPARTSTPGMPLTTGSLTEQLLCLPVTLAWQRLMIE